MTEKWLTRRSALVSVGAVLAAGTLASYGVCTRRSLQKSSRLERLDVAVSQIRNAREIGAGIRARTSFSEIQRSLEHNKGLMRALDFECPEKRLVVIRDQVSSDFRSADIVVESRWVLSKTECLIAALRA